MAQLLRDMHEQVLRNQAQSRILMHDFYLHVLLEDLGLQMSDVESFVPETVMCKGPDQVYEQVKTGYITHVVTKSGRTFQLPYRYLLIRRAERGEYVDKILLGKPIAWTKKARQEDEDEGFETSS